MKLAVAPLTPDRWSDLEVILNAGKVARSLVTAAVMALFRRAYGVAHSKAGTIKLLADAWWASRPLQIGAVPLVAVLPFDAVTGDERSRMKAAKSS